MIIVTGGGSGIGAALAQALARRDEQVLIVGRRKEALKSISATFPEKISYVVADLSSSTGREKLVSHLKPLKRIKALVHNAGLLDPLKPLADVSLEEWRTAQAINVEAPLFLTQALLEKLQGGRVLHLSSGAAHGAYAHWGAYCTSKAALYMLYQTFKQEVPNVLFGSVMPGITDTAMQGLIRNSDNMPEDSLAFFRGLKEEDKLLSTDTVAEFLSWLLLQASDKAYSEEEWDIYDSSYHSKWLKKGSVPKVFDDE